MTRPLPPRLPSTLLSAIAQADQRDALLGDLHEEYLLRAAVSPQVAARWYWSQAVRSAIPLVRTRARRARWWSTLAAAIGCYVLVGALNAAGMSAIGIPVAGEASPNYFAGALVGLLAIAIGAHVASRIRPCAGEVVGAFVAIGAIALLFSTDPSPFWYQLAFLAGGPMVARLGSVLAKRQLAIGDRSRASRNR